jgi:hypothetical protein
MFLTLPIQNCLKRGDALSQLLLNYALEYVIWKRRGSQEGLNWMELISFRSVLMILMGENINTIKAHTYAPLDSSKEVGLDVKAEKLSTSTC